MASTSSAMHPASLSPDELLEQVRELHARRSGPGGQHRNKTQTAVVLTHVPTGITAEASERRSQAENRQVALRRLRLKLAIEHRSPSLSAASELWRSRTQGRRLVVSATHADYPTLVAEALDQLQSRDFSMPSAAELFGVTATQLLGLFRKEASAWTALNSLRAGAGLPPLK